MASVRTYKQAVAYLKGMEGKAWNPDRSFDFSVFDVANQYWLYLFNHTLKGVGAADIPTWNDFTGEATVYKNTPSFQARPGDVVIFNRNYGSGYGHVGVVLSATLNSISILEQNWLGVPIGRLQRLLHVARMAMTSLCGSFDHSTLKKRLKIKLKVKQNPLKS